MKIRTGPKVSITDKVKSPSLFGYFRPRLLLPKGILEKLNNREMAYIFMHELGHLKRHDIGISWIINFLQIIHWFNPLVWFAFYRIRIDQESACDEYVLSLITQNKSAEYAKAIFSFLDKFCRNKRLPAMVGILENKSQIKRRISMIVNYRKHSKRITTTAIVVLIITGFTLFTVTGFAKEEQPNTPHSDINWSPSIKSTTTIHNSDEKRINEDASNLIIEVTKEGEIWIENQEFHIDSVKSRMELFMNEYPDGNVVLVADKDNNLESMISILDQIRMAGIGNIVVATSNENKE